MDKDMKIIAVAITSVLILIFGALLGILISINFDNSKGPIIITEEEYDDLGLNFYDFEEDTEIISYSTQFISIEEFYKLNNLEGPLEEIFEKLKEDGYEIDSEEEFISAEKETCKFNEVFQSEVCTEEIFEYEIYEDRIVIELTQYREEAQDE